MLDKNNPQIKSLIQTKEVKYADKYKPPSYTWYLSFEALLSLNPRLLAVCLMAKANKHRNQNQSYIKARRGNLSN